MRIYLKNTRAKFHPDPIWNDGAWGFLKWSHQQEEQEEEEEQQQQQQQQQQQDE